MSTTVPSYPSSSRRPPGVGQQPERVLAAPGDDGQLHRAAATRRARRRRLRSSARASTAARGPSSAAEAWTSEPLQVGQDAVRGGGRGGEGEGGRDEQRRRERGPADERGGGPHDGGGQAPRRARRPARPGAAARRATRPRTPVAGWRPPSSRRMSDTWPRARTRAKPRRREEVAVEEGVVARRSGRASGHLVRIAQREGLDGPMPRPFRSASASSMSRSPAPPGRRPPGTRRSRARRRGSGGPAGSARARGKRRRRAVLDHAPEVGAVAAARGRTRRAAAEGLAPRVLAALVGDDAGRAARRRSSRTAPAARRASPR